MLGKIALEDQSWGFRLIAVEKLDDEAFQQK